ncbi:MAG: hypothetical protein KDC24_11425 [Saprospiraceae bacterium]|nr:hypothetical protein [Saprospiraceae bacterium]
MHVLFLRYRVPMVVFMLGCSLLLAFKAEEIMLRELSKALNIIFGLLILKFQSEPHEEFRKYSRSN